MNIFFKIKHYLLPYLKTKNTYESIVENANQEISKKYWISGYSSNILKKKWEIEDGIPLGLYNGKWKTHLSKRTHVSALCEYFFALEEIGQDQKQEKIINFIKDNICKGVNPETGNNYYFWKTYLQENCESYFVHGMGQGQLLSVLSRAQNSGHKQQDLTYLIKGIMESFKLSNHKDAFVTKTDGVVIQEYPHLADMNKDVLNGWILGLLGLYDALTLAEYDDIKKIFNKSIETLELKINKYDIGFWSLYNQPKSFTNICSAHYHDQHIAFLNAIGTLLDNEKIIFFSNRFQKYKRNFLLRLLAFMTKVIANLIKYKRFYKS